MATQIELVKNPGVDINSLNMSEGMKAKMRLVQEHFVSMGILFPKYDLTGSKHWSVISVWAFLFSCFYYFVKGMWRKGLLLFFIAIIINILMVILDEMFHLRLPSILMYFDSFLIQCIAMESAYYDIYRAKVLNQKFWW